MLFCRAVLLLWSTVALYAAALDGTAPFDIAGDPAEHMVNRIKDYLLGGTRASVKDRRPTVARLRQILGVVDQRVSFHDLETFASRESSPILAQTGSYVVKAVRWPAVSGINAEGILLEPTRPSRGLIIAIPDADQEPEQFEPAQQLAAAGFTVLAPALINRKDTYSGNPDIRMTNQPHREWLYRMTYPLGRHVLGIEIQKVLAAVDWAKDKPVGVWGYGEGGAIALYAAAIDNRIRVAGVSGYFGPRENLWQEPIYRNVFGLLRDFGDAELASLIAPRRLIIDVAGGPTVQTATGSTPGALRPIDRSSVETEVHRAGNAEIGNIGQFVTAMGGTPSPVKAVDIPVRTSNGRQQRAIREIEAFCAQIVEASDRHRAKAWTKDRSEVARRLRQDLLGELPVDKTTLRPRTREIQPGPNWRGYEVALDAAPGVPAYGVLLIPSNVKHGEKLPTIVMQHGLDGRPQDLFNQKTGRAFDVYQNIGQRLINEGFVVYLPQNPYIHDFRPINRLANPLGLTMFSFILRQHERTVEWLQSLSFVDPKRVGFYGLSYGGTTALRVPPLVDAYAVSICSGNFNEWIRKLTTTKEPYSYMFTKEYEIFEFDIAHIASHAEMAMLTAPRPFMVERGHADGVGIDEWVAYEYAKVARYYQRQGIRDLTSIAYFEGPHRIDGAATIEFLKRYLTPDRRQ
ncbi:MAG TPA: dienelactone hydrolase family protein [Bryobacteraceae bacterium]|nr:dienelactone hydrolase family protein [Bryobacteraceae bacterium]